MENVVLLYYVTSLINNTGSSEHMLTCDPHAGSVIQRLCIMAKCFFVFLCIHAQVCNNTSDRKHADTMLERYVTETVMSIVTCFFSSPFSDQSTSLQVTVDVAHLKVVNPV